MSIEYFYVHFDYVGYEFFFKGARKKEMKVWEEKKKYVVVTCIYCYSSIKGKRYISVDFTFIRKEPPPLNYPNLIDNT